MNKSLFPVTVVLCLFVVFLSCSSTPQRSRKPISTITVQPLKQSYTFGDEVSVQVKTKVKNGEISNIRLYYKNELIKESRELDFTVEGVKLDKIGNNSLSAVAIKTDSVGNTRTKTINVVSDVEPQKMTYQTINNYPHNTNFYTEGFEYHDGYIYEGTGENGSSGIYKTDLKTGKILQSRPLDAKYFGEGITILNGKIYQLTYHAQKCFVYNLRDFSKIDSFQYSSREGWGLTNDGKYLIMSNGTQFINWLDPNDLSVVKTLQVANKQGIINNLNELEYIDGTLYANVYGTNVIVQFDPETGKVLSEINMEGILNMYQNSGNKVDYMNGIAWDEGNQRFFVTGKWWPRIFEVKLIPSEQ